MPMVMENNRACMFPRFLVLSYVAAYPEYFAMKKQEGEEVGHPADHDAILVFESLKAHDHGKAAEARSDSPQCSTSRVLRHF